MTSAHWFTVGEFAQHFSLRRKTVYSLISRDLLPKNAVKRFGKQIRLNIELVEGTAMGKKS